MELWIAAAVVVILAGVFLYASIKQAKSEEAKRAAEQPAAPSGVPE